MKKKDNWDEDIIKGEEIEYKLLDYLKKKYPQSRKIKGEFKDFDIEVPEKDIKIEVKRDIGSNNSNNFFIEYECNYKESGISSTKATHWAIYDESSFHWLKTSKLKALCEIYGNKWEGTPNGGVSNVKAFLIPKDVVMKYKEKT